ncbi:hypothetical protein FB451DRAFT_1401168 [Mycena latifolia]|nr:hypothetical protein FB451DRAFT_1401168 [Mycena latifolia]
MATNSGAQVPTNFEPSNAGTAQALDYLRRHVAVKRLSKYASVASFSFSFLLSAERQPLLDLFAAFAPRAFGLTSSLTDTLFTTHPDLERLCSGPWTTAIFDLQTPAASAPPAIRWWRLAIMALGDFNPDRGGHLILWDLGCVLRFPAGTTVLIPPILRYSIARVQPGETRYSLIQYAAHSSPWSRWPAATYLYFNLDEISSLHTAPSFKVLAPEIHAKPRESP